MKLYVVTHAEITASFACVQLVFQSTVSDRSEARRKRSLISANAQTCCYIAILYHITQAFDCLGVRVDIR